MFSDFLVNSVMTLLPARCRRRIVFKVLRSIRGDGKAFADLFVPPYDQWTEWHSGIGDGHVLLYGMVRVRRPRIIVEIGSACGKSTCAMALACEHNGDGVVVAIDPHDHNAWSDDGTSGGTLQCLQERLDMYSLNARCEICRLSSVEAAKAWNRPIDMLFIDGDHSYDMVRHDFEAFRPWFSDDALVVFHDSLWDHHKDNPWYRCDMGVPAYLQYLQDAGFQSVTIGPLPGLTIVDPRGAARPFLTARYRPDAKEGAGLTGG